MSTLFIDENKQTILGLFSSKETDFLIPDYQRPYAWTQDECETLWNDIFAFAFPDDNYSNFNVNDKYFLGSIVFFENENEKLEVIDGQQRLTTFMLLLRAFYKKIDKLVEKNDNILNIKRDIEKCIWKIEELGNVNKDKLKIDTMVATDDDKNDFINILKTGEIIENSKSNYVKNYKFFVNKIDEFSNDYLTCSLYLPIRILNNCIFLPIKADTQETALRIFSTLNDRGLPLSDADIFKAQLYKYYNLKGEKNKFVSDWKELENKVKDNNLLKDMNELFTRYMYYERAKLEIKTSTTEGLRSFYEKKNYELLKNEDFFDNLIDLADFWDNISSLNINYFLEERILRKLFILNYAPNGIWKHILSVYYLQNKNSFDKHTFDIEEFYSFLDKLICFIWSHALTNQSANSLRTPIYAEMINIVNDKKVEFDEYKFEDIDKIKDILFKFDFSNRKSITKPMLVWWAFKNEDQKLPLIGTEFQIEHIFARNKDKGNPKIELIGNKSLLEKTINIRATDYPFERKRGYYQGKINNKPATIIKELLDLSEEKNDFTEKDIEERDNLILNSFIEYIKEQDLIKK